MLQYKTKNHSSPQGKRKVFFCCHPEDFPLYFESISDEVLSIASCSIWFSETAPFDRDDEFYYDLAQMTLFVVPITSRLLNTSNPAINEDIPFALKKHIPILPLMQEKGLEAAFNEKFHELQYLDRCAQDDTAISYSEKLKSYLTNILVEDQKEQQIRDAFCAQLFLSYRKKDRRHAHRLMERIHDNVLYRDVAIWYDEFLIPGENFNQSIETELNKSDAFVMAVTPNLVNEVNYIRNVEYPSAKKANKPIVPVEMVNADKELLTEQYDGIPPCVHAADARGLRDALGRALPARISADKPYDAEHEYLIGLAYLHGIGVEVNRTIALEMITSAADHGCEEAMEKLAYMYSVGDGVEQNLSTAIHWQKTLADRTYTTFEANRNADNATVYATTTFELGSFYQRAHRYEEAKQCLHNLKEDLLGIWIAQTWLGEWDKKALAYLLRIKCICLSVLAEIAHSEGDLEEEEKLTDRAIDACEELNEEWRNDWLLRDLSVLYRNKSSFFKVKHDIDNAITYCEKALRVQKQYAEASDEPQFRFDLAYTYHHLSELCRMQGKYATAKENSQRAVESLDYLLQDEPASVYLEWKGLFYLGLAESCRLNGDYEEAMNGLDQVESILVRLEEVFGNYQWYTKYYCLLRRAQLYTSSGQHAQIITYAEEALRIQEEHHVIDDKQFLTGDTSLLGLHFILSSSYCALRNVSLAKEHAKISTDLADKWHSLNLPLIDTESILPYTQYATILMITDEQLTEAKLLLERAIRIATDNCVKADNLQGSACWYALWFTYGRLHLMEERMEEAFRCFQKAEECYENFLRLSPPVTTRSEQIALNYNMGCCLVDDHPTQAKLYLQKVVSLVEGTPADERTLSIWELLGLSYYMLLVSGNVFNKSKWTKKLCNFLDDMARLYPDEFPQTAAYQVFADGGIFDE